MNKFSVLSAGLKGGSLKRGSRRIRGLPQNPVYKGLRLSAYSAGNFMAPGMKIPITITNSSNHGPFYPFLSAGKTGCAGWAQFRWEGFPRFLTRIR